MEEISYSGDQPRKTGRLSKRTLIFLGLFIAIVILLLGVGFFVSKNSSKSNQKTINIPTVSKAPTLSPTPEPKESPTPTISSKSSSLKISVQNGSGESGVAAKASEILKTAGYDVVSTGNADNFDYTGVTIQIKNSKKSLLSGLEDDLSNDYTVSDTSTDLPEDETFDALVIVGK